LNLLDENFPADQAVVLRQWRIQFRQIGRDVARFGVQDPEIIPLLHRLKRVTLFTQDQDFFKPRLCHPAYCLVWLDVKPGEAAFYVRRFLRHPAFDSRAKRMGIVARVNVLGLWYWQHKRIGKSFLTWNE
jgi:hypothetical protein